MASKTPLPRGTNMEIQQARKKELTLLLLGETGVGKSTFINAFANYLMHETMEDATGNTNCLIPSYFTVYDDVTGEMKRVSFGKPDQNEVQRSGRSGTQACRSYGFSLPNLQVRLIDTPGIADTEGVKNDGVNMQNLLNFLAHYKEIDGICILLKPNNARVSVVFKYCILQLLTHLDKSASSNILFLFTNARSTFYRPGDTAPALLEILQAIKERPPHVTIPFVKKNTFCLDNEAFRFLVASSPPNNVSFATEEKAEFNRSWNRSVQECQRLIEYVLTLPPHRVEDTLSVNKARTSILLLCQPLGDIAKYIADNLKMLEDHKKKIFEWNGDIKELQKNLYTPTVEVTSVPLEHPRTVCGDDQCCDKINVKGTISLHYKTICHDRCYLESSDGNIIGNIGLLDCQAFNTYNPTTAPYWMDAKDYNPHPDFWKPETNEKGQVWVVLSNRKKSEYCDVCKHSYQVHLHIYSETKVVHKKVRDDAKYSKINNTQEAVEAQQAKIEELQANIRCLKAEEAKITEYCAKFAHFLRNNALTPFNDAFEEYLLHVISNEKSGVKLGIENQQTVESLEEMLNKYRIEKDILEKAMKQKGDFEKVTTKCIQDIIDELCSLKMCGSKIRNDYELQKDRQGTAHREHKEIDCQVKVFNKTLWDKLRKF